jgi:hypothetical protein
MCVGDFSHHYRGVKVVNRRSRVLRTEEWPLCNFGLKIALFLSPANQL